MPDAPPATWEDPALLKTSRDVALGIEAAFLQQWPPVEAGRLAEAIASPEGQKHDKLMERLTPLVMSRSEPFVKSFQTHLLKRYSKIYNVAWEQHQREKAAAAAAGTAPAQPSASR